MRTTPPGPRVTWKVLAIANTDAVEYARKLEEALQQLTDDGFNIINQMHRNDATILTAQRLVGLPAPAAVGTIAGTPPPNPRPAMRTFRVDSPDTVQGVATNEVLYHYKDASLGGALMSKSFPSLVDALRYVREHLNDEGTEGVGLTTVSMTRFDPADWPALFRRFADELRLNTRFDSKE